MREAIRPDADQDALMRELGYVLLNWSMLEKAFIDDIQRLRLCDGDSGTPSARTRSSFNERLAEWRALATLKSRRNAAAAMEVAEIANEAEQLGRTRNLIVQHFAGVEEDPGGERVICASEGGIASFTASQFRFTRTQLADLNGRMLTLSERVCNLKGVHAN